MDEASKQNLCEQFVSFTGVDVDRANFFLESADWNIELAIQSFYEHGDDSTEEPIALPSAPDLTTQIEEVEMSSDDSNVNIEPKASANKDTNNNTARGSRARDGSNIATLSSLHQDKNDEGGQAFYAGGSEHSGQEILGPREKPNTDRIVKEMFRQARENAEIVDREGKPKGSNAFVGSGFTLGSNESDSKKISGAPSTSKQHGSDSDDSENETVLKLWQNGFSVDEGPLRAYDDPTNKEFLASIQRGEIPRELSKGRRADVCHVSMEDHRQEEYQPPKKKPAKAFGGEGHRLGTPASEVIAQSSGAASNDPEKSLSDANAFLKVNQEEPNTRIQIRLADGSRLVAQINLDRTVSDLRQFICIARPEYAFLPFNLMTTFPNKTIDIETASIKESGLANSSIVQRLN